MTSDNSPDNTLKVIINPLDRVITAHKWDNLLDILRESGVRIENPCGGEGTCGKCRIILEKGELEEIDSKSEKYLTDEERESGYRLACQSRILGDIVITLPSESRIQEPHILTSNLYSGQNESDTQELNNLGLAIDVGTTTIVGQLINLENNNLVNSSSTLNRQITYGEGLLTRINYTKTRYGLSRIQRAVVDSINEVIDDLVQKSGVQKQNITKMAAGGNPVMLRVK